jgi:uncharacterized protein YjiK
MMMGVRMAAVLCGFLVTGCRGGKNEVEAHASELAARAQQVDARLAKASSSNSTDPIAIWIMPEELHEISGLALTADGRLFAHDDEVGKIYQIDEKRGVILKRFALDGSPHADFEAITIAGSNMFMMTSNGVFYQFREGRNGANVPYVKHDTHLGHECEFEGAQYQADSAWMVMPCKTIRKKSLRDQILIYRWRLNDPDSLGPSVLTVPVAEVAGNRKWKEFRASDITIDPATGNYVIISSLEKGLVELTREGDVVRAESLPGKHHQAEGVAITKDGILIVSDEATTKPAAISLYNWRTAQTGVPSQ